VDGSASWLPRPEDCGHNCPQPASRQEDPLARHDCVSLRTRGRHDG
jgi:hypothetical protein